MTPSARAPTRSARAGAAPASTTPVGHWWAGVSTTARAPLAASASTSRPCVVDRDRHRLASPAAAAIRGRRWRRARVLERDPVSSPRAPTRAEHEAQRLLEAGAHDQVGRARRDGADPASGRRPAPRGAGGSPRRRRRSRSAAFGAVAADLAHRPGPVLARHQPEIGDPGPEVGDRRAAARRLGGGRGRGRAIAPPSAATRVADPPRLTRGSPRPGAGRSTPGPARATDPACGPAPATTAAARRAVSRPVRMASRSWSSSCARSGVAAAPVEREEQLRTRTGPLYAHGTGPYQ